MPPRTRSLTSYSVAIRRRDGGGRRRVAAGALALLLVGAVGLATAFGAIGPRASDDRPAATGAMALSETAGQTPEPVTPEPVTPEPVTPAPVTPEPVTPKPATAAPVTPEPATPAPEVKASSVRDGALTAASDDSVKELKTQGGAPTSSSGWVCDGQVRLEDPRKRSWSLGRAAFRAGPGYERVVLNLKRLGPGRGDVAALTAESMSTAKVRAAIPGVARPSLGQTTVSLHLTGDIAGNLGVRAYRPKGLRLLKEFSVYPAAGGSSRVLISAASDQCFRVRVPDWSAKGPNTRDAKVYIDIRS